MQASRWLQSYACRSGNILDRTEAVIAKYRNYLTNNKEEIEHNTGLPFAAIQNRVIITHKTIRIILSSFLRGNQLDALQRTRMMMRTIKFDKFSFGTPLYKCRENSKLFHLSKDEMFHIPYNKRHLVGNQRFSLSGLPCLYLGGSSYICWEELGRKDFSTSNYCGYTLKEGKEINLFDLLLPEEIKDAEQITRVVLILSCSLAASRDCLFKPEYILPQCILHSLINRAFYSHSLFCVRYYSSHFLNGDADYFEADFDNKDYLPRYVNYVFPAASSKTEGFNDEMKSLFKQTETVSLLHETLLTPEKVLNYIGSDPYLRSQFGLMDSVLDVKLGFVTKRTEGDLIMAEKGEGEEVAVEENEE